MMVNRKKKRREAAALLYRRLIPGEWRELRMLSYETKYYNGLYLSTRELAKYLNENPDVEHKQRSIAGRNFQFYRKKRHE